MPWKMLINKKIVCLVEIEKLCMEKMSAFTKIENPWFKPKNSQTFNDITWRLKRHQLKAKIFTRKGEQIQAYINLACRLKVYRKLCTKFYKRLAFKSCKVLGFEFTSPIYIYTFICSCADCRHVFIYILINITLLFLKFQIKVVLGLSHPP